MSERIDLLNHTAADIQRLIDSGSLSTVELVKKCLEQIERHNYNGANLRAVIDAAPLDSCVKQAEKLDHERITKGLRSPMHGIPVLVKDNFATDPALGMGTTCGTLALRGARPRGNAVVIDKLMDAGMIVIGKASLSELCLLKATPPNTGGWCSVSGQGQSPYVVGGVTPDAKYLGQSTPCGSSSGSAIGVAAGFAPVSIGTETDGSIVYPATRAGLYAMKPSLGAVPLEGAMPVNNNFDTHGGMAKSVQDLANLMEIMTSRNDLAVDLPKSWVGFKVGFLDFKLWRLTPNETEEVESFDKQSATFDDAMTRIKAAGAEIVGPVTLLTVEEIAEMENGADFDAIANDNWKAAFNAWIAEFEYSPIKNMEEMVEFHRQHADKCLPPEHPSQAYLEYHAFEAKPDLDFEMKLDFVRTHARDAIDKLMDEHGLDVILGNGDGRMTAIASAAGYPVGSVPLGYADFNGRAFGMNVITGRNGESKMLKVMSAWEATFPEGRKAPLMLVDKAHG